MFPNTTHPREGGDPANNEAGFSLLEVIVALAVFSLGALALLNVIGESTRSQQANQTRAIARIVAENQLVEVMALREAPAQGSASGTERAMNRTWQWERTIAPTEEPRILRIDVRVSEQGQTQTLAEFSSFRSTR